MKCYTVSRLSKAEDNKYLGIYIDWIDCERIVKTNGKLKDGVLFKKHESLDEAYTHFMLSGSSSDSMVTIFGPSSDNRKRTREGDENAEKPDKRRRNDESSPLSYSDGSTDSPFAIKNSSESSFRYSDSDKSQERSGAYGDGFTYNSEDRIICYTDGNCHGNGKKGARAGYGIYFGDNHKYNTGEPLQGSVQTNQRAELTGIQKAIELTMEVAPGKLLEINTDSEYSKKIFTEWIKGWKAKNWRKGDGKMVKNQDIIEPTDRLITQMMKSTGNMEPVKFVWVKGHSGIIGNDMADKLASEGIKKS